MIAGVRGVARHVEPGAIVMSVGPIDLRVSMPVTGSLEINVGQQVEVHTHLYVREDQLALYGFRAREELEIFELLLSVSGVGPKVALAILSALQPNEIRRAINHDDPAPLTRAVGVGARAAARIVTDLKGKVGAETPEASVGSIGSGPQQTVLDALTSMGYAPLEARRAVEASAQSGSVENILREALARLAERP